MPRWFLVAPLMLSACTSVEDHVRTLAFDPDNREAARQGLLLAKDRAVVPLLAAFDDPEFAVARPELAESLLSLLVRIDDRRLPAPTTGDLWGFNLSRTFRNTEYAQWVHTSAAHAPDEFGILRFD